MNFCLHSGEHSLDATAERRSEKTDPANRARAGYKVDVIIKYTGLHWTPEISCGEVSGGLPRCTRAKEWADTVKLVWKLRDMWNLAQKKMVEVDATDLVIWGFTVVGELTQSFYINFIIILKLIMICELISARTIRIYLLSIAGGLFHLVLAYEAPMPSALSDLWNVKLEYLAMMGYLNKLNRTWTVLSELNKEHVRVACAGVKPTTSQKAPPIINTPLKS